MPTTLIENVRMVRPGRDIVEGALAFADGRITACGADPAPEADMDRIDGGKRLLTPGMIDVHTHGIHRHPYEGGADELLAGLKVLPRYGTTAVLPTLYKVMTTETLPQLEEIAGALEGETAVAVPGLHLEGPFLKLPGAGAATFDGDLGLLDEVLAAARNRVAAMSVSPDTVNIIPVIERLRERGIVPFITHTQADYEQTCAAIEAGARHATHFYDVFYPPEPTDGGVRSVGSVEALLEDPRCTADFIADGTHVHPGAIRLALRCKGWRGVVLITDSNIGAGLPAGVYETGWGYSVKVAPGQGARVADPDDPKCGGLAGSALTMDAGINNLLAWLDLPEAETWAAGTLNPARLLGLEARKGTLEPGADADFVLWDRGPDGYRAAATWINGKQVWTSDA